MRKKTRLFFHLLTIGIVLLCNNTSWSQTKTDWFLRQGGEMIDHGKAIAVDQEGNLYVTGGFQSTSEFNEQNRQSRGDTDIFLAKYSGSGKPLWMIQAGGDSSLVNTLSEYGNAILYYDKYIYVAGVFLGTAIFGPDKIKSHGKDDIFLAKYSLDGKLIWAKAAGGENQDIPYGLTIDAQGNILMVGSFQRNATFAQYELQTRAASGLFYAKYGSDGDLIWAKQFETDIFSIGKSIRCEGNQCAIVGDFQGNLVVGDRVLFSNKPGVFVARFDAEGKVIAAYNLKSNSELNSRDLILNNGEIFITGNFKETILMNGKETNARGNYDVYLCKLDKSMNLNYLTTLGSEGMDNATSLIQIDKENIVLTGNFQGTISKDAFVLRSQGASDFFYAYFSRTGQLQHVETFGGIGQDQLNATVLAEGHLYSTGFFRETLSFDEHSIDSRGASDILVAKTQLSSDSREKDIDVSELSVYPNPSQAYVMVEANKTIHSISLIDLNGKTLLDLKEVNSKKSKFVLDGVLPGLYIIKVLTDEKIHEKKLIKRF